MKDDDIINSMIDYGDDDDDIGNTQFIDTEKIRAAHEENVKKSIDAVMNAEHDDDDIDATRVIDTSKHSFEAHDMDDTIVIGKTEQPEAKQYKAEDSNEECFTGIEGEDESEFEDEEPPQNNAAKVNAEIILPEEKPDLDFEYDDYSDYDDYDEEPLLPMILGILKIAAPVAVIILIAVFIITSENSTIARYRNNFSANTERLLDNMGINIHERQAVDSGENQTEVNQENTDAAQNQEQNVPEESQNDSQDQNAVGESSEEVSVAQEESEYKTYVQSSVIVPFQGASEASFVKYKDGIVCARTNYICYINDSGETEWEYYVSITDPVVKAEGNYILLAQNNGKKFFLYKGGEQIYENSSDDNILSCNISANGDAVLVTERPSYKGAVVVYNKRGDKAFSWSSGNADIISADISDNSRRVAAALVHTEEHVSSSVYLFNIKMTDPYAKADFDDSLTYNVEFKGNRLTVFSDNLITGMDDDGDIEFNIGFDGAELVSCNMDDSGNKTALFTQDNIPMINVYNKNGSLRHTVPVLRMPDYMEVENGNVIYNVDRDIILGKPDAKRPYKYTAAMDISGLIPINDSSFMLIYSNGIEMVRMGGGFF